ncbi:hypothetical protein WMY93_012388 [Mugilogobius chulae]|uniref:Inter-alpha-trypsin inhibitor heavy chain H3-like n=1 Tax=Mugilogobius chulae TaxID=88201 RepID=A0AAW0PE52_9GOBI
MDRSVILLALGLGLLGLVTTLPNKGDWDIYSFHINSTVTSRYASTIITSRVANRMEESKEIQFHVQIPKNAFITKFRMFMDGEVYDGVVKEKEQAQRQYTEAVSRGQSAGIVSSVGRTMEEFKTSVTVAAHKKVTFELTYEELLKRRLGKYELQIFARPMQPVNDFKVDVHINEDAGVEFIEIKGGLSTKELANAITKTVTDKQAWIYFYPTVDQQKVCDSCSDDGMNGDLVVFYDVKRNVPFGDIQTRDGYFVHHFAPSNLPRIPKNVVFVIDQSGSMHGRKMEQTRIALIHILGDLAEDDFFGLITFDSEIFHWKRELVQANSRNIEQAKKFAEKFRIEDVSGLHIRSCHWTCNKAKSFWLTATDINRAVLEGTRMLNAHPREDSASILILLTDGDPTSGETNPERIQANVRKAIAGKFPLYCLGFGFDVNFEFLEKMSLDSKGLARRIYEDSDANLQLQGFYEEVATPLLTDVTMIYIGGSNLTQTNFSQYYNGSEIVVAGVITDNNIESFIPEVVGLSRNTKVTFASPNATESTSTAPVERIQRVWAYLTVKQLIEKEMLVSGSEKEKVKKEAMDLSLKYNFVTPHTSMVVTKPPGEDSDVLNKPKEGQPPSEPTLAHGATSVSRHIHRIITPLPAPPTKVTRLIMQSPRAPPPPAAAAPGQSFDYLFDLNYNVQYETRAIMPYHPIVIPDPPTTTAPPTQRFLLRPESVTLPLCFDLPNTINVKLLHLTSRGLDIKGLIGPKENGGFTHIFIHVQSDLNIEWTQTASLVTVIIRDKEIDVSVGDIRFVILIHEISGRKFLWPVLRQRPLSDSAEGVLVYANGDYEERENVGSASTIKVKGKDISASRSSAVDYSLPVPITVDCWLLSAQSDFYSI